MIRMRHYLLLISACLLVSKVSLASEKVIYGIDNRVESNEFSDQRFTNAASSVAGMVWSKKLYQSAVNQDEFSFNQLPMRLHYNVCEEERFSEQVPLPTCTAFLVGPDLLLTAGHCVRSEDDCKKNTWFFDYVEGTEKIHKNNMYSCKKLIDRKLVTTEHNVKDYALIQLDRPVEGREPLKIRISGKVSKKTPVIVIGHPIGLPMKIADGAQVSGFSLSDWLRPINSFKERKNYFVTNTDTYMGNSGSPVFNENTGLVEGILIQGKKDFYYTNNDCLRSINYKKKNKNSDEKVLRILKVDGLKEEINKSFERTNR